MWARFRRAAGVAAAVFVFASSGAAAAVEVDPTPAPSVSVTVAPRPGSGQPIPAAPPAPAPAPATPTAPPATPAQPTPAGQPTPTGQATAPARPGSGFGGVQPGAGGGILANLCRKAPEPELPGRSWLDVIAFGDQPGTGMFGQYRFAGWRSHLYNPGCQEAAIAKLADAVGGPVGMAGDATTEEGGPNRVANAALAAAQLGVAVSYAATKLTFGVLPVWQVADGITDAARVSFGQAALAGFLALGIIASMMWLSTRRGLDFARFGATLWRIAGVVSLGLVLIAWNGSVGAQYDSALSGTHRAASSVVAGDNAPSAPADMAADAAMRYMYMPMWGAVHLGWDRDAVARYAERLHAASAFTLDEANRVANNEAAYKQLAEQKQRDYDAVAQEIARSHPAAYTVLEGKAAGGRVGFAALLAAAVLSLTLVVGFAGVVALLARVIVRVGVGIYPVVVAVLQFPTMHRWGIGIPQLVLRWALYGVVATAAGVVIHRVMIQSALTSGEGSVFQRVAALTFVNVALIAGWLYRDKLAAKAGVSGEYGAISAALNRFTDAVDGMSEKPRQAVAGRIEGFRSGAPKSAVPEPAVDPTKPAPKPADAPPAAAVEPGPTSDGPRPAAKRRPVVAAAAARTAARVAPPQARPAVRVAVAVAGHRTRRKN